ncbi:MAG: ABC transporter permease [Idiomarina sp.]|nr:ABC transporter permease [Idiomarina sp.]MCL4409269.1 ABC transporter permease [Gammaproteobacteria bacterium]MCL5051431.1 ABC transporter permease [Bacillota bacterium]
MQLPARSSLKVTLDVWYALFMREAMARMTQDRLGPLWLFLEPILHLSIMIAVRNLLGRTGRLIPGAEFIPWLIVGILTFILFRNQMNRGMHAVEAARGLFAYRQVQPVDTIFSRCALEFMLQSLVAVLFLTIFVFIGFSVLKPDDVLAGVVAWIGVALVGLGIALVFSVAISTVKESGKFVSLISFPLYMLSGVIFPIQYFPHHIREVLMYNPLLHGVESMRMAMFSMYQSVPGIDITYTYKFAICLILFGLAIHARFRMSIIAR